MSKRFILLAGNIGSGKTTMTRLLGEKMGWQTSYESVADNPYLSDFYGDMAQWGFHLQVYFLGHRAEQHLALATSPQTAVADRSIYEDAHIFARALHQMGSMNDRDYRAYRQVFDLIIRGLPRPDLLVYLDAPIPLVMDRIRQRGREMESGITAEYLSMLKTFYDEWTAVFDICSLLTIKSETVDLVNNANDLDAVIAQIEAKLNS